MSLINWNIRPHCIELATDTLAYNGFGAPLFKTSKFFTVPHARMMIADQGASVCAFELHNRILNCDMDGGIDEFVLLAPGWLHEILDDFVATYGAHLPNPTDQEQWNLAAFGWSPSRKRMLGFIFASEDGFAPHEQPDGERFNPGVSGENVDRSDPRVLAILRGHRRDLERFASPASFIAVAKLQQILVYQKLGYGIGGDLMLASLTRDRLEVRKIYTLPPMGEAAGEEAGATADVVAAQ